MTRLIRPVASLNIVLAHNGPGDAAGSSSRSVLPMPTEFLPGQLLQDLALRCVPFRRQLAGEPLSVLRGDPSIVFFIFSVLRRIGAGLADERTISLQEPRHNLTMGGARRADQASSLTSSAIRCSAHELGWVVSIAARNRYIIANSWWRWRASSQTASCAATCSWIARSR